MTRAEEAAMKAFPDNEVLFFAEDAEGNYHPVKTFGREVDGFILGYEQAEKDLALSLAQVVKLDNIIMNMVGEGYNDGYKTRPFYEEVLKRFNEQRKK